MLQKRDKSTAKYLSALLTLFISSPSFSSELYKTIDGSGHTVYSDHPVSSGSQKIAVQVPKPDPDDAARLAREQALTAADVKRQARQHALDEKNKTEQAASQQQQNQRCIAARNRHQLFADGGLIYKRDEQGNRSYYSNEEIEALRAETNTTMERYCGG